MEDFNATLVITPPGQSGIVGSKYYDNAIEPWLEGHYFYFY